MHQWLYLDLVAPLLRVSLQVGKSKVVGVRAYCVFPSVFKRHKEIWWKRLPVTSIVNFPALCEEAAVGASSP